MEHEEAATTMAAERYVLGELHDTELERFEEHFFGCPECAQDVRDLSTLTAGAREVLGQPQKKDAAKRHPASTPARTGWWSWLRPSPSFALGGALALVTLVCGYQGVMLRMLMRPQAMSSIVLRSGQSRGPGEPTNQVEKTGPFLRPLEVYLDGASGKLQWELEKAGSGKVIWPGTADSPRGGEALVLSIPSSDLTPGQYDLIIRSVDKSSGKSWFYKIDLLPTGR